MLLFGFDSVHTDLSSVGYCALTHNTHTEQENKKMFQALDQKWASKLKRMPHIMWFCLGRRIDGTNQIAIILNRFPILSIMCLYVLKSHFSCVLADGFCCMGASRLFSVQVAHFSIRALIGGQKSEWTRDANERRKESQRGRERTAPRTDGERATAWIRTIASNALPAEVDGQSNEQLCGCVFAGVVSESKVCSSQPQTPSN